MGRVEYIVIHLDPIPRPDLEVEILVWESASYSVYLP